MLTCATDVIMQDVSKEVSKDGKSKDKDGKDGKEKVEQQGPSRW